MKLLFRIAFTLFVIGYQVVHAVDYIDYPKLFIIQTVGVPTDSSTHLQSYAYTQLKEHYDIPKKFIQKTNSNECYIFNRLALLHICIFKNGENKIAMSKNDILSESFRVFGQIKTAGY